MLTSKNNKGQAVVEMALVLPILLLILFGIIEFGRIFNADLIITNASREGARIAAVGASDTEITNTLNSFTSSLKDTTAIITITPIASNRTSGEKVTVQIDYKIKIVTPLVGSLIPNPFPISSKTVMRIE